MLGCKYLTKNFGNFYQLDIAAPNKTTFPSWACDAINKGPDRLESIILKIIGKKIYNPPSHLQSIIPENFRFFAYYSGKL